MEHTKGKWEVSRNTVQVKHSAGGFLRIALVDGGDSVYGANARRICQCVNSHDDLLAACKAQHEAIDRLFAMFIQQDDSFRPSKSGQPWEAIKQGNMAIVQAENAQDAPG